MKQATGGEPTLVDTTGLCLLSLDGGGVRGLSTLYILKSIFDRLNYERKKTDLPSVKPCEVFDLIGGTSTGGLIAIMLGRLEMDVDDCIAAYSELAAAVFGGKLSSIPVNIKGKVKARFDSAKLESAIRKVIKNSGASEDVLFNDGTERGCRTFVCAADRHIKDIIRLRSYSLPNESNNPATIYQAALATSAATTFFDPVSIGDRSFADGGLGANNPVDEVEGEASNIWCSETGDLKPLVKCFISIGTGNPGKKPFDDSITKFLGQTVVQIATETENTEKKFIARWARHFDEKRYFRFNVEQGLQEIGLEEYKKKGAIEAATQGYLTHMAQQFRVRDCIQNMRLKQNKPKISFAALVNENSIRTIRQQPATQRTPWIVPFEKNPRFTGRESQLAQLEEMLFATDRTTKVAIMGLGGVGKTQLALELIFRTKEKHADCSIIWIPATNTEALHQAYLNVAHQLGISGLQDEKSDVKRLVQGHLSKESTGRWLLVFDNADDIDMWISKPGSEPEQGSQPLTDYLPKSKQGVILFTTRDKKIAVKLAHQNVVDVPAMGEDAATRLLEKYLVNPDLINSRQDTNILLSQLTYLPLAIVQAAAYINENTITLRDYISLLADQEEEVIELLSEEFEDDGRYRDVKNPVATTWLISFEQIRRRDPLAADYLSFMACVEPKDIPPSLLPPAASRKREVDALGTLIAYSFIIRRVTDVALDLHRLVHLATRNWLRKEGQLALSTEKAIVRLEEVFPDHSYENRSLWRTYLTHVCCALESSSSSVYKDSKTRMNLLWRYGMCLYKDGRWDEAETPITQVLNMEKRMLGADHSNTLTSMGNLALLYSYQGRWEAAEELQVQVMETRKTKLGADHPDTLRSISNLASTYRKQGQWEAAEELEVQVMETRKTKLGADHPDTLTSMNNLAFTWKGQGRDVEAISLMADCVERRQRILGVNHPDYTSSLTALTEWRKQALLVSKGSD
ncbi:hypothetical protein GJ744_010196 [Endocarpon pusillum]|uniref:PNPLA domain-containing protein n=1 Tax=Endocarpon pusillum TaxID=364733 RepID=A0A8H7E4A8_9EURO|nr:hypothetical protein GJ744_010196 [Endocarpon pusillum]